MTDSATEQSKAEPRPGLLPPLCALLFLALLVFLSIDQLQPPKVVPAGAPAADFSAARALEHLKVIAQKPHPTGSAENARVRAYLMSQLKSLGLDPQIQTTTVTRYKPQWRAGVASAATVNNFVARLPGSGTDHRHALMLAAHYDSVPSGPGASDDGSGTVTLLETARALKAGPPLRNDVIFLFTDAEELGLLGAQAFVDEHPWAKDVAVVLNFEARGACGPSFMFETSPGNGWLIRQFAPAAPYPVTSSLMYDFYKRMPNDTDFTVFKRAGMAGFNFAYAGCWPRYHTRRDDVADLEVRSLQHDGSYALALAHHFGNLDLSKTAGPDAVYFSVFDWTIHYPKNWVAPLTLLTLALFAGVVALGLRRRRLALRGIAVGFLVWAAGAVIAAGAPQLVWRGLQGSRLVSLLPYGMAYNGDLYALGFMALTVAVLCALYNRLAPYPAPARLRLHFDSAQGRELVERRDGGHGTGLARRTAVENLTVGALGWWALLTLLSALYLPGGSYLGVWPLLAASLELAYSFAGGREPSEAAQVLAWTLPAIVGVMLFAPLPYELLQLVSTGGLPIILVAVALLVGFLVPLLHILTTHWRGWPAGAAAVLALALIGAAMLRSGYDAAHPRADSIFYILNAATGKASWASADPSPDVWTSQFLSSQARKAGLPAFPFASAPTLQADAPSASLRTPEVAILDDVTLGEVRVVRLRVTSPRGAVQLWLYLQSAKVLEADVNGKKLGNTGDAASPEGWGMIYSGVPEQGLALTLKVPASQTPTLTAVDVSETLPEFPGITFRPRPPDLMPSPAVRIDSSTLVSKTFRLDSSMPMEMHH